MAAKKLEIRIWTDGATELPEDLPEVLAPHASHVAQMLAQGYVAGQIVDDRFMGWWEIKD